MPRLIRSPGSWQRLLALSGVAFAALFLVGWFTTNAFFPAILSLVIWAAATGIARYRALAT